MQTREQVLIAALGVVLVGAPSAFWLVTAADPVRLRQGSGEVRDWTDVALAKDSDLITGFIPTRTTIAERALRLFLLVVDLVARRR